MSQSNPPPPELITELQVSAHLMQLDAGVYCVYHTPGSSPPDETTGLPGARLTVPPGTSGRGVTISGFRDDGWLGTLDSAALVRVTRGPAQVLMTVYQLPNSGHPAPKFQVTRLVEGVQTAAAAQGIVPPPARPEPPRQTVVDPEVAAHVQVHGDILARLDDWVGEPGSQRWVEGFALAPRRPDLTPADIEYQAVLGRGWLSPWAEGGQFCGSRGMALPILGLRVRLRGDAAQSKTVRVSATFTDGTSVGPVGAGEACESESLAPLEAFLVEVVPLAAEPPKPAEKPRARRASAKAQAAAAPNGPQAAAAPNGPQAAAAPNGPQAAAAPNGRGTRR